MSPAGSILWGGTDWIATEDGDYLILNTVTPNGGAVLRFSTGITAKATALGRPVTVSVPNISVRLNPRRTRPLSLYRVPRYGAPSRLQSPPRGIVP